MHDHSSAGVTHWFIAKGDRKEGPLAAVDIARLLETGEVDWDARIWRDGLGGWTPIQGDHALMTAIAAVRGVFADTSVFSAPEGLVPGEDTVVEPTLDAPTQRVETGRDDLKALRVPQPPPLLASTSPVRAAAFAQRDRPETNAREAQRARVLVPAAADTGTGPHVPVAPRSPVPHSWMPSVRSMLLVAGLAFVFGVVVAALWGRLFRPSASREDIVVPALRLGDVREPSLPAQHDMLDMFPSSPTITPQLDAGGAVPVSADSLRREVRRVSLDVHRCLPDPADGVQVEVQIEGKTGRPSDVRVVIGKLSPGASACVVQALRQLQIPPFSADSYRLSHRFAW